MSRSAQRRPGAPLPGGWMRRRGRGRFAAVTLAAALLVVSLGWAQPQPTTAAFTDDEHATAYLEATAMPVPTGTCTAVGLLGAIDLSVRVEWNLQGVDRPLTEYGEIEYAYWSGGGLRVITGDEVETSGNHLDGFTSEYDVALLGLMASADVALRVRHPSGWTTPWLHAEAVFNVLIIPNECTVTVDDTPQP